MKALLSFLCVLYFIILTSREVQCSPIDVTQTTQNAIVYRRYVRRRPPTEPGNQYIEEYMEVFYTPHKPPAIINPMSGDEDVDKFLNCDRNSETEECIQYWEAMDHSNSRTIVDPATLIVDPATLSSTSVKATTKPMVIPLTAAAQIIPSGSASKTSTSSSTTTANSTRATSLDPTIFELPPPSIILEASSTLTDWDMYRIPDIPIKETHDYGTDDYDGLRAYNDEEDLLDQNPNTRTPKNLINIRRW